MHLSTSVVSIALAAVLCALPVSAQTPTTVLGRVITGDTGTPVAGATVRISSGGTTGLAESDRAGEFRLSDLAAGNVVILVTCAGFLDAAWPEADAASAGAGYTLAPGATLSGIEIRLQRGGAVEGQVIDVNGLPVAGRAVVALARSAADRDGLAASDAWRTSFSARMYMSGAAPAQESPFKATTDDRGRFRLHTLPLDTYVVGVLPRDRQFVSATSDRTEKAEVVWAPGTVRPAAATPFAIEGPQEHAGVTIRLAHDETAPVAGLVVDGDGTPVAGAMVLVSRVEADDTEPPEWTAIADVGGRFRFDRVPHGLWRVEALHRPSGEGMARRVRATAVIDVAAACPLRAWN